MSTRIRDHIRSNVYGLIAIFIALGGTAYAVNGPLPGKNTVGSADIINREVKKKDLSAQAVTTGKLADNAITNPKLADNAVAGGAGGDIQDNTIDSVDVLNGTLTTDDVANGSLDAEDLGRVAITAPLDRPNIASGDCGLLDVAVGGLVAGEPVIASVNTNLPNEVFLTAEVGAANSIQAQICNLSGADYDPPLASFRFIVLDLAGD